MKKAILSLAVLCVLTAFSGEKLMSAGSNQHQPFNKKLNGTVNLSPSFGMKINPVSPLLVPVSYRNMKPDAGSVEIYDITTGTDYGMISLPPTGNSPVKIGVSLAVGDFINVTVYSGNGDCSIKCNDYMQTGVSSLSLSNSLFSMPDPSWLVIQ